MKKLLCILIVVLCASLSAQAVVTVERSLILQVGQTVIETCSGGSGCTITNYYQDVANCVYASANTFVFSGVKRGFASVKIDVPGYVYIYNIHVVDVINISLPSEMTLYYGDRYLLEPIKTDVDANTAYTWKSYNTSVATVDSDGWVTACGVGTVVIMCIAENGITAQCLVRVMPNDLSRYDVDADGKVSISDVTYLIDWLLK